VAHPGVGPGAGRVADSTVLAAEARDVGDTADGWLAAELLWGSLGTTERESLIRQASRLNGRWRDAKPAEVCRQVGRVETAAELEDRDGPPRAGGPPLDNTTIRLAGVVM